jgi:sporulation protein YlmC with PRC-barrel domain
MLRGISDLKRFTIAATDGNLGSVSDLYFDDRSWAVRYLVVDAGPWLPGRRLFVSPTSVRSSDPTTLRLGLSMKQVEISSVSSAQPGGVLPESLTRTGNGGDLHLQTATAVMGYAIRAEDGEIGHVRDVLVDAKAWAIRYLVVDTEQWWAGKTVLVSPGWFTRVTWDESKTLFCIVTTVGEGGAPGRPVPGERSHHNAVSPRRRTGTLDHVPVLEDLAHHPPELVRSTVPAELAEHDGRIVEDPPVIAESASTSSRGSSEPA